MKVSSEPIDADVEIEAPRAEESCEEGEIGEGGGDGSTRTYDWSFGGLFAPGKEDAVASVQYYIECDRDSPSFDPQVESDTSGNDWSCPVWPSSPYDDPWTAIRLKVDDPDISTQDISSSRTEVVPNGQIEAPALKEFADGDDLKKKKYPVTRAEPVSK